MDYLMELTKHYENMNKSKSKKQQKIDKKANEKNEEEVDDNNSKHKLKRVFPDNIEKTEKSIESLTSKISKLQSKLRRKVNYYFKF